jgi:head-tail adaptor
MEERGLMPQRAATIGKLTELVIVQEPSEVDDGQGGTVTTWIDSPSLPSQVWASVEPEGRDLESIANMAMMATAAYRVVTRYHPDFSPVQRLLWTPYRASVPKTLQVHSVVITPDRKWSILRCSEVQR